MNQMSILKNKRVLILSCCAPCSIETMTLLKENDIEFSILFYNPNIFPDTEYQKRLSENKRICQILAIPFYEIFDDHQVYLNEIKGLENEPEQGKRCTKCFAFRLKKAFEFAKENNFDLVTSVLGVSRFKNQNQVNIAAFSVINDIPYFDYNWKEILNPERKKELIKKYDIYNQNYCGCEFSKQFKEK
ncbi:MAG: epoxyqueuosine reductase QueH [Rickettsiales bacterium]|jgi:predicted adenine nucleotide alpha hydrolase (AANH) superfamily ATPase|nr:epoxyqueuosine reductase QueH [Rickettsiales bacterium]